MKLALLCVLGAAFILLAGCNSTAPITIPAPPPVRYEVSKPVSREASKLVSAEADKFGAELIRLPA